MSDLEKILALVTDRKRGNGKQMILALAGAPASGKTTLAHELQKQVPGSVVLPMDGFHLDNAVLDARGDRDRKGAPQTFDVAGFTSILTRLRAGETVFVPTFDRDLDLSRAAAVEISPEHPVVIVEGNYLLLKDGAWADLHKFWDASVMIDVHTDILRERLIHRWLSQKMSVEKAHLKVEKNDLPNAQLVQTNSITADLIL